MKQLLTILTVTICLLLISITKSDNQNINVEKEYFIYFNENLSLIEKSNEILLKARDQVINLLGDSLDYKPKVYIFDNLMEFEKLVSGEFPDWGVAAAVPEKRIIAIKSPLVFNFNKNLNELLTHEYVHLITAHKAGYRTIPRWLDEGLAMYISMEWSWSNNLAMSKAAVFGNLIPLSEIDNVNKFNENKAQVAYAISYLTVKYLVDEYGSNVINRTLKYISIRYSISVALDSATGSNLKELQSDLDKELDRRFNIASLFMDTIFFWLFLAFIVILGFFINYKRRKKYFKKWDEEERLQSLDFEFGDSENPEKTDDSETWQN